MEQPTEENVEYHIEIQNCPDGVDSANGDVMFVLDLGGADIPENLAMTLAQWAANGSFDEGTNSITVRNDLPGAEGQVMHIEAGNNIVIDEDNAPQVIHVQMEDTPRATEMNGSVKNQVKVDVSNQGNKDETILTGRVPGTKTPMILDLGDKSSRISTVFNSKRLKGAQQGNEALSALRSMPINSSETSSTSEKLPFTGFTRGRTPVMLNLTEEQDKILESSIRQSQSQILINEDKAAASPEKSAIAVNEVKKAPMILNFSEEKNKLNSLLTATPGDSKDKTDAKPSVDEGENEEPSGNSSSIELDDQMNAKIKEEDKPNEDVTNKNQEQTEAERESKKDDKPVVVKKRCKYDGCEFEADDPLIFASHLEETHQDPHPFCCFDCDRAFKIKLTLLIHQIMHIKNPKPTKTKRGPYSNRFKHMYFQCPLCSVKKKLKKQIQVHVKEEHYLNEIFTCDTCKLVCFSDSELSEHKKTTSHETDHRTFCEICKQSFTNIYQHKAAVHSTARPYLCNQCGYTAKTKSSLKYHMVTHLDSKDWACPTCPYKSNSQRRLKRHMKIHDPNKKHLCSQCPFATHDAYEYKRHFAKVHSRTKSFTCKFCSQTFTQHHEIRLHLIFEHDCNDAFFCTYCEFTCATRAEYKEHIQVHYGKNKHVCEICGFTGRYRTHYRRHMLTHTSSKPYTCPICKKSVREASNLRRHMLTHSDDKPLACSVCGYRCKIRSRLMNHMKTHAELRPFACHLCNYTTKFNGNLVKHLEYHAKYKPHKCQFCSYSCNERNKLKRHMNFRHKGMVVPKEEVMEIVPEIKSEIAEGDLTKEELVNVIVPSKDEFVIVPKEELVIVSKDGLDIDSVITLTDGITGTDGVNAVVLNAADVVNGTDAVTVSGVSVSESNNMNGQEGENETDHVPVCSVSVGAADVISETDTQTETAGSEVTVVDNVDANAADDSVMSAVE